MKRMPQFHASSPARAVAVALGAAALIASQVARSATTDLSDIPLANAPTTTILPNIMFILDDSGSMDWNYMPDYVNTGSYCRDTGTTLRDCDEGDPPWYTNSFNGVYYNPMVNYAAPKNADGSTKSPVDATASTSSPWDKVPVDGYKIQSSSKINLVTGYPERMACKDWSDDVNGANCKSQIDAANAYTYPDSTYDTMKTRSAAPFYYTASVEWCSSQATSGPKFGKSGTCQTKKTSTYKYPRFYNWSRVDITPARTSYPGPNSTTRTYTEEMNNFANWYAWYRTRMQMMKTAMSLAFADVRGTPNSADATDKNYFHARVGFTTINNTGTTDGSEYLAINNFDTDQKSLWFTRLFAINPDDSTPLRKALVKTGRIYAGQIGTDPVQYSCQRNFAILSSDGYYNDSSTDANKMDGSTDVGDQDGDTNCTTISRPSCDKLKKSNTLADVAYYYYHTDLRSTLTNNVTPAGTNDKVDDVATHQHMTTFTIGLGLDGTLTFQEGYKTSTSGDYYDITQGTKNWPDPGDGDDQKIDDLWHAAVNGRGTYFSARDPESLVTSLTTALGSMESTTGSGAAAATSNLQPVAGDNFIYIANYRTEKWDGELSAYTIDLSTGAISGTATWQAATLLDAKIASSGDSDTRTIYTSTTGASALKSFIWSNLTATEQAYFDTTQLAQYGDWSATDKAAATGETLVNYLRGQHRNEDQERLASFGTYYRLYRDREKTLGDIVHSQPVYVKAPFYSFTDTGYSAFKSAQASRAGTVYVAANDGMLHAFDSSTGQERWAYLPAPIMKNLWQLADKNYSTNHKFFVDGPIAVSDVNIGGAWKTILVGGFGKGGRGYYALDITVPTAPVALWTFTADNNPNVGYSYGMPMITKLADGTWVVAVTSGYNNIPEGSSYATADGQGYVFVLSAATGGVLKTISTGVGSVGSPAGLAHLNLKVADFETNNTALRAYGGDLYGNMWRFDLDGGTTSKVVALSSNQPITAPPELGEIDGKTILFFGTGSYLGQTDLSNNQTQSLYGIRDDGTTTVSVAGLVQQTISGSATRTVTSNAVNWTTGYGWYANLVDGGERVNLPAQLYFGTVIFASTVPTATACQPGGYSWMYFLDFNTGGAIEGKTVSVQFTSPIVGITVARLPGGTPKVYAIKADGGIPKGEPPTLPISTSSTGSASSGRRVMWRELLD